jgi:hypothetical protein
LFGRSLFCWLNIVPSMTASVVRGASMPSAAIMRPPPPTVMSRTGRSAHAQIARAMTSGAYTGGGGDGSSAMWLRACS